jgi:hypothetical protein
MIKTGRDGQVLWDPAGVSPGTPVVVVSLNSWKLSLKTDRIDVSCFGDVNRVYVPGLKDVSGSLGGYWNSEELALVEAADMVTPGLLKLVPHSSEATFFWSGLAYMDADIDTSVDGAPALTGTFSAAGPWSREPVIP